MLKKMLILLLCIEQFAIAKIEEQPLRLIITSYNNADWYKQNLDSVFMQKYTNYKVLYFDDCSTDNTANLVEAYIKENNQQDKWTIIKNTTWQSQMANHYKAVQMCDDDAICLHLDGDDWIANADVFNIINETYKDDNIWLTAGRPIFSSTGQKWSKMPTEILEKAVETNGFRNLPFWPFTHLRTFRASLFKSIKLEDLLYQGTFSLMSPAPDLAFMLPMVEMAAQHMKILDEDLYVYNTKNSLSQFVLNNDKVLSLTSAIYSWTPYQPLTALEKISKRKIDEKIDAIILLSGEFEADHFICSRSIDDYGMVICLYPTATYKQEDICNFKKHFPNISFYEDSETNSESFLNSFDLLQNYIFVVRNEISRNRTTSNTSVSQALNWLEKTQADACALESVVRSFDDKRIINLDEGVYAYTPTFMQDLMLIDAKQDCIVRKNVLANYIQKKDANTSLTSHLKNIHNYVSHERAVKLFLSENA